MHFTWKNQGFYSAPKSRRNAQIITKLHSFIVIPTINTEIKTPSDSHTAFSTRRSHRTS